MVTDEIPDHERLKEAFKRATEEVHNKELAALMGEVDPDHPETLPGGIMSVLGLTNAKLDHIKKKKRDKHRFLQHLIREAIRDTIAKLNEIIKQHEQRMIELLEQMEKADRRLRKLDEQYDLLEHELEHFQDHGVFDLDQHEHFRHEKAEAMIAAWEEKMRLRVDRSDPSSYEAIFSILIEIEEERIQLRHNAKVYTAEYEYHKQQQEKAKAMRDELQSGDPSRVHSALGDFGEFMNHHEEGFENTLTRETSSSIESDEILNSLDVSSDGLSDEFSLGFPPLKEGFTHAITDHNLPNQPSKEKVEASKDKALPLKPGSR